MRLRRAGTDLDAILATAAGAPVGLAGVPVQEVHLPTQGR
jgi:hypothetical protein